MSDADELNLALKLAVNDPEKRIYFYNRLLKSDVYFITNDNVIPHGSRFVSEDTPISIFHIQNQKRQTIFPFFTSPEDISKFMGRDCNYIKLNAQVFFRMIECGACVLNPSSDYGKEFTKEELTALIDGSLLKNISPFTSRAGDTMLIGQPNVQPIELIDILKKLFSNYKIVSESYIAQIVHEGDSVGPHPIVAVKASGDLNEVFEAACALIGSELVNAVIVDFIDLSKSAQFSEYFRDILPFYKRLD